MTHIFRYARPLGRIAVHRLGRIAAIVAVAGLVISGVVACGSGDAGSDQAAADFQAHELPTRDDASAGGGTLVVGDARYEFSNRVCDFSGETDGAYQTLVGRGTRDDGEQFDLFVERNEISGILSHGINVQVGDWLQGDGYVMTADRARHGGSWLGAQGEAPDGPLVRIQGDRLRAEGLFVVDNGDPEPIPGVLEATCQS